MKRKDRPTTRRKMLRNLGIAGFSASGLVLFTSDRTTGNTYAQEMQTSNPEEIRVAWTERYNGTELEADGTDDRSEYGPVIDLGNVLPGDSGSLSVRVEPEGDGDNGAEYSLSMRMNLDSIAENGITEPERKGGPDSDPDTTPNVGELQDEIQVTVGYDSGVLGTSLLACDGSLSIGEFGEIASGSLADVASTLEDGISLDPPMQNACFAPDEGACVVLAWDLPESVGNSVQTDSVRFDLAFGSEACE